MVADSLPEPLRQRIASAWSFRYHVEREAQARFARLASWLEQAGAPPPLVELARRSSEDERRHAAHCAALAHEYGTPVPGEVPVVLPEIAPRSLSFPQKLLYELVAASCVAETVSVGVLMRLRPVAGNERMRAVLHELLQDEVVHSRLGWAYLAHVAPSENVTFLGRFLPDMLEVTAAQDVEATAPTPEDEDPALLPHGVLPHTERRALFASAMRDVVMPGLDQHGVPTDPAREWLGRYGLATPPG
ncbi:ferritin-like domain-containing protein [Hyalangium versicolor]|uniref:ferritin-like domain-containing protein n=1 Tax=Hyalangium versicolor TaxID=2861190 RepID=UPI001CCE612C|nr:ferritin-like domain-containing protein [Hyalangium versicolor]